MSVKKAPGIEGSPNVNSNVDRTGGLDSSCMLGLEELGLVCLRPEAALFSSDRHALGGAVGAIL